MCADSIIRSVNPKVISIDYFTEIIKKVEYYFCAYSLLDWVEYLKQSSKILYITNQENSNEKFHSQPIRIDQLISSTSFGYCC